MLVVLEWDVQESHMGQVFPSTYCRYHPYQTKTSAAPRLWLYVVLTRWSVDPQFTLRVEKLTWGWHEGNGSCDESPPLMSAACIRVKWGATFQQVICFSLSLSPSVSSLLSILCILCCLCGIPACLPAQHRRWNSSLAARDYSSIPCSSVTT